MFLQFGSHTYTHILSQTRSQTIQKGMKCRENKKLVESDFLMKTNFIGTGRGGGQVV